MKGLPRGILAAVVLVWLGTAVAIFVVNFEGAGSALAGVTTCLGPGVAAVAGAPAGTLSPGFGPETPRLVLGDPATSGLGEWPGLFDMTPIAYDFDGDGREELVAQSYDASVYVFDTESGRALAQLPTSCPRGWYIERVLNGVSAGVLRPGEPPSLVVADPAAYVTVWRFNPAQSTSEQFAFDLVWERRMNDCFEQSSMDAGPVLADLDRDRSLEILIHTEEIGFFALDAGGQVLWHQCWAGGNSAPVVADLEEDASLEVIFAADNGFISVISGATGTILWTFDAAAPEYGIQPASVSVTPTVAELDGLPGREILFTTRHAPGGDPSAWDGYNMAIWAIHRNMTTWQGELLWMRQPEWANPLSYTRLIVEDVDGDNSPDIFGMDWNTIGHKPGNWEVLGPAHVFRLDADGQDVWVQTVDAWWSNKDLALLDVDGDGVRELVANGPTGEADGLLQFSVETGQEETFLSIPGWKVMRNVGFFDFNHDGTLEMVVPAAPNRAAETWGALLVYELQNGAGTT